MDAARAELRALSRSLGDPGKHLAILAEGNASARISPETFLVKASGFSLADLPNEGLIEVEFAPILNAMATRLNDDEVRQVLKGSRVDQTSTLLPSVETFMHAWLLSLPGVAFVGHTHPTSLLSLLCLADAEKIARQRLFPDEIVLCGPESCFVKYVDPGGPLAAELPSG